MSYETTPIGQWDEDCWHKFYHFLDEIMGKRVLFGFDPNKSNDITHTHITTPGGVSVFLYTRCELRCVDFPGNGVNLEIHPERDGTLEFKVWICPVKRGNVWDFPTSIGDNRSDLRNECSRILGVKAMQMNRNEIEAPAPNPRPGKAMRFGMVERRNWLGRDGELINKERVLETLPIYEQILEECFATR